MNIGQLIEVLAKYPEDTLLVMSADEEGNSFSPLFEVAESMYVPEGHNYGQTYVMDEHIGTRGYTEEDRAPEGAIRALILWP